MTSPQWDELIPRLREAMDATDAHTEGCETCRVVDAPALNVVKLCEDGQRLMRAELQVDFKREAIKREAP